MHSVASPANGLCPPPSSVTLLFNVVCDVKRRSRREIRKSGGVRPQSLGGGEGEARWFTSRTVSWSWAKRVKGRPPAWEARSRVSSIFARRAWCPSRLSWTLCHTARRHRPGLRHVSASRRSGRGKGRGLHGDSCAGCLGSSWRPSDVGLATVVFSFGRLCPK